MDMRNCDFLHVQAYEKYNDNHRYTLSVLDAFSKFLYLITVKIKSGPSVASAFRSIFEDNEWRSVWVRKVKRKECLNKHIQDMLLEGVI